LRKLTHSRQQAQRLILEDGPLSHLCNAIPQSGKQTAPQEDTSQPPDIYMAGEDQEEAQAIARGVSSWKILTDGRRGETDAVNKVQLDRQWSPTPRDTRSLQDDIGASASVAKSYVNQYPEETSKCPFASLSDLRPEHQALTGAHGSVTKRPDSLPTPPEMREEFITDPPRSIQQARTFSSPPPSATGSASKCPIRYLDERSPEDIARYFEIHKHEIPRSHEVCVKRYQSNEESIRQLDAKYGNLVSMIQGLGVKHKPLLPAKEEEECIAMERRSMEKVEKWADNVKTIPDNVSARSAGLNKEDDREGHFDRPLEDIKVGESPSRPWGIRVPIEEERASSASLSPVHSLRLDHATKQSRKIFEEVTGEDTAEDTADISNKAETSYPSPPILEALTTPTPAAKTDDPRMLFTGPVFIGYPLEQAAELIRQIGTGMNIPRP